MEGKEFVESLVTEIIAEIMAKGIDESLEYLKREGRTIEEAEKKIQEAIDFLVGLKAY